MRIVTSPRRPAWSSPRAWRRGRGQDRARRVAGLCDVLRQRPADPTAIAVDASGNAYLTGLAGSGLPTVNALQPTMAGGIADAFVARLNATASALVFSTYLGGSGDDAALAIALDGSGNIYLAGPTRSVDFPQQNALPPQFGQARSNFVVKMTPDGRSLVYSTYFADARTAAQPRCMRPRAAPCISPAPHIRRRSRPCGRIKRCTAAPVTPSSPPSSRRSHGSSC